MLMLAAAAAASAAHAVAAVVVVAVSLKAAVALAAQSFDLTATESVNANGTIARSTLYAAGVGESLAHSAPMLPGRPASASPLAGTRLCPGPFH